MSLLMSAGTTPEGMYALLAEQPPADFKDVTFYNLDEYCEPDAAGDYQLLDRGDPRSYQNYMARHLFYALPAARTFFPGAINAERPGTYDERIEENGGIDLAINSIGEDGHTFGFNLPGTEFDTKTHLVALNEGTKAVNERLTGAAVPDHAITTGLHTGMQARRVVTLVSGSRKAAILQRAVWDDISTAVPATILRRHPNHTFLVDQAAAANL
jgi:glucosamine-6-phosphate deaminase